MLGKTLVLSNFPRNRRRAIRHLTAAYETYQRLYDRPAYKTGLAAFWLGKSRLQEQKYKAAEEHFLDAIRLFEETSPPGHELQLLAHGFLIALYEERGKSSQADAHVLAVSLLRPGEGVDGYKPLYRLAPVYPRSARVLRREGFVLVEFTVTTRGRVTNIRVLESEGGKDIEHAALEALKSFRYAPAIRNGEPIETHGVRNLISFVMAN
ncbi:MAG: TonB family protein [Proteobacteria bacterium]|nr:TonB family protein [Pseudomonadota bacterium]